MQIDKTKMLVNIIKVFLDNEPVVTRELINNHIENQCTVPAFCTITPEEKEHALKMLLANYAIWMNQEATMLCDNIDHDEWLSDRRKDIDFVFWERYREYLSREGLPDKVLTDLDRTSDIVLGYLEDPAREGYWDRRGMVVGDVQSGKTSNYTGLICKAADAGYKVIIVLAGLHNSLRSQTQIRIDAGFCGRDSRNDQMLVGAGLLRGFPVGGHNSLTSSSEDGDFRITTARNVFLHLGGNPLILVVKKNATVLKSLINWLKYQIKTTSAGSKINDIPLLLIDDEADNASVNGKTVKRDEYGTLLKDEDPTRINKQIRTILNLFQKTSYVGYTATPFANIFIYPTTKSNNKWGEDLFPRSFIVNLPTPNNYIGPATLFGLDNEENSIEPLPIIRTINDCLDFMPDGHKRSHSVPSFMPPSLEKAVKSFIISCSVRTLRGQENNHNSMLVHVTRFVDVQSQVAKIIDEYIRYIRSSLKYNSSAQGNDIWDSFQIMWSDYMATTENINRLRNENYTLPDWSQVKQVLYDSVSKIDVKEINGSAKDVLDYNNRDQKGMYVIAVGGDKLSRGLTLEGLTVSYYLRASKMYDTLMQMGRWFGYRPDYLDLCRLYTSDELVEWYRYIALASQELREEFDYMYSINATPEDFGLRVRNHPGVLQITATNKLRHGTKMKVSFKNSLCETVHFDESEEIVDGNLSCLTGFVKSLEKASDEQNYYCWKNIDPELIISFLSTYKSHPLNNKAEPRRLAEYIENQNQNNELTKWTVCLISKSKGKIVPYSLGGLDIGLAERTRCEKRSDIGRYSLKNGRLISENHELLDLSTEEFNYALKEYQDNSPATKKSSKPSGIYIRRTRPPERGLLLLYLIESKVKNHPFLGYAVSFPDSTKAKEIEYTVTTKYWRQYYGED